MLFKPELAYKVLRKEKTETRRLVAEGDFATNSIGLAVEINAFRDKFRGFLNPGDIRIKNAKSRDRYVLGRDYPVQPGRGKQTLWWRDVNGQTEFKDSCREWAQDPFDPNEGRMVDWSNVLIYDGWQKGYITVDDLWREDVRDISEASVKAEGFEKKYEFLLIWMSMHDPVSFRDYSGWVEWLTMRHFPVDEAARAELEPIIAERVETTAKNSDPALYDGWAIKFHRKESV